MIPFNIPYYSGREIAYLTQVTQNAHYSGDGIFTKKCSELLCKYLNTPKALLTPSCTHALEIAAMLVNLKPGDEVIMPSFNFPSAANAFALRGAKIVFVDIRPDTMNIDENLIEKAISTKTKAIVVVHYGGIACEMDRIMEIAISKNIIVIEDTAHAIGAKYKNKFLGTIGHLGCLSFHDSKNIHCGEGGALLINRPEFIEHAEIIRDKGTNRARFFKGEVDKYSWVALGSSYLLSDINAAILLAQLEDVEIVNQKRKSIFDFYKKSLQFLAKSNTLELPDITEQSEYNGHIFYVKAKDIKQRDELILYLKSNGIAACFHYIPLHSSEAGIKYGIFSGNNNYTTSESEKLLRLPIYESLTEINASMIVEKILAFYKI